MSKKLKAKIEIEKNTMANFTVENSRGKTRSPSYVDASLLALNAQHGGNILKLDLLKVPHHGSETASTQAFINQVDPDFVIISAATNHRLPRQTVVNRYVNRKRISVALIKG